jgi:hypothetical protein
VKKLILSVTLLGLFLLSNSNATELKEDSGKLSGYIKAMSVLDAKDNGYDPNNGWAHVLAIKYLTPEFNSMNMGFGVYYTHDILGLTNTDSERLARGMFVNDDTSEKLQLGELYLKYKRGSFKLYGGRMIYNSPLTTNAISTMPNFHTVYGSSMDINSRLTISISRLTEISWGARSMTDFALIGEGTNSAGVAYKPSLLGQSQFHNIAKITLGKNSSADTDGISIANINYKLSDKFRLSIWDYYVHDIANNIYIEANKSHKLLDKKIALQGQYLTQSDIGDKLAKDSYGELDYSLVGFKIGLNSKKWGAYLAYNRSHGDTAMLNAWGGDVAYTSSIFSRNAYRKDVTAYKIGAKYKIRKGLTLKVAHAHYKKSDSKAVEKIIKAGSTGSKISPLDDATESDIILSYKASKNLSIKIFHAKRSSEYSGVNGKDLTQAHTRVVGVYKF